MAKRCALTSTRGQSRERVGLLRHHAGTVSHDLTAANILEWHGLCLQGLLTEASCLLTRNVECCKYTRNCSRTCRALFSLTEEDLERFPMDLIAEQFA